MRCLTLADALAKEGVRSHFICRNHPGNLAGLVRDHGHLVSVLPCSERFSRLGVTGHAMWLGASWEDDADETREMIGVARPDWLVVDHYALGIEWETALRPYCHRLMAIDDLADRIHDCDLLLDQNLVRLSEQYDGLVPQSCERMIGPRFALLREDFSMWREASLTRREAPDIRQLLISLGGVDKDNATGAVLHALRGAVLPGAMAINVVMGPYAPWLDQVREQAASMPWQTRVLVNVSNMAELMAESDIAVGAAGATSWERCCLGLPAITLVLADNQRDGAKAMASANAVLLMLEGDSLDIKLPGMLATLMNPAIYRSMQYSCAAITDGKGTSRVAAYMLGQLPQ